MANKDLRRLLKDLEAKGFRIREIKSGWLVLPEDRELNSVTIHATPSDWRAWRNQMAALKRIGYRP